MQGFLETELCIGQALEVRERREKCLEVDLLSLVLDRGNTAF